MAVDAVLFDWGGTLSTYADIDLADMWRMAARHFAPDRAEEVCRRLTEIEAETFGRTFTDQRSSTLDDIVSRASEELGLDVTEAVRAEAATRYLDSWTPHILHEPDAVAVLGAIRDRGFRTGMLSNTHWPRGFHEHFLERDGLIGLIDIRLYTSELEYMKPHPSVFARLLEEVGVDDPGRAVFVGDRIFDDVHGAMAAGLRGVWRRTPLMQDPVPGAPDDRRGRPALSEMPDVVPDAEIVVLSDLLPILDSWSVEDFSS